MISVGIGEGEGVVKLPVDGSIDFHESRESGEVFVADYSGGNGDWWSQGKRHFATSRQA